MQAVYYRDKRGRQSVEEFIDALPLKHQVSVDLAIDRLNDLGSNEPPLPFPASSQVDGELRELRCITARSSTACSIAGRGSCSSCCTSCARTARRSRRRTSRLREPGGRTSRSVWTLSADNLPERRATMPRSVRLAYRFW
jgi:hypothetical protein